MWVLFSVVLSYLTEAKWDTYNIAWAPTGMDKGAFALSRKSWKMLSRDKPYRQSQFERPRRCFSVKKDREWLFNADYFISVYYKRIVLLYSYFEAEREDAERVPRFAIG